MLHTESCWQIVIPDTMAIVSFRYRRKGLDSQAIARLHTTLLDQLLHDGTAVISSSEPRGRSVLRLCTINPRTTDEDLQRTMDRLGELVDELPT